MSYECNIDGCDYSGEPGGLRSHVSSTKDEEHQAAREDRAWTDWYPDAYEAETQDDEGGDPSTEGSEGVESTETDPEETRSKGGSEGGSTPTEGAPDPDEEYREQWETQESEGSEGGSDPSESGDGDSDDDPEETGDEGASKEGSKGSRKGAILALAAPLGALLAAALAKTDDDPDTGEGGDPSTEGSERVESTEPGSPTDDETELWG
jgi:hypothetical protein